MENPYPPGFDPRFGELKSDLELMRSALIRSHTALAAWTAQEDNFLCEDITRHQVHVAGCNDRITSLEKKLNELRTAIADLPPENNKNQT